MTELKLINKILDRFKLTCRDFKNFKEYEYELVFEAFPEYDKKVLKQIMDIAGTNKNKLDDRIKVLKKPLPKPTLKGFKKY